MKKTVKITLIVLAILFGILLVITIGGGIFMVNYALDRESYEEDLADERIKMEKRCPGIIAWWDDLIEKDILKDTIIVTSDGRSLHAQYAAAEMPSKNTAIIIHGYKNSPVTMCVVARMFRDSLGFNVFMPSLHAHGRSDGKAIRMGWKDKDDIKLWIPVAHEIFHDEKQVIHGISMGAATVMMLSGEPTPDYVKAFIEDAGYTSVWEMYKDQLKEQFGLPPFPILYGAEAICKIRYGWSFHEASSLKQLEKSTKPMLFIHGDADDFVPTRMMMPCYDAKKEGYKEYWLAPGSIHVFSYIDHPEEYCRRMSDFLKKVGF
mgnify:FL=1